MNKDKSKSQSAPLSAKPPAIIAATAQPVATRPFQCALTTGVNLLIEYVIPAPIAAPAPAAQPIQTVAQRGNFTLHLDSQTVLKNGKEISLSSKEFALLCYFMENPDTVLSKQEIFSKIWKSESPDDNSILVYIKRLRDKIEDNSSRPEHLMTVWGKGYKFIP